MGHTVNKYIERTSICCAYDYTHNNNFCFCIGRVCRKKLGVMTTTCENSEMWMSVKLGVMTARCENSDIWT